MHNTRAPGRLSISTTIHCRRAAPGQHHHAALPALIIVFAWLATTAPAALSQTVRAIQGGDRVRITAPALALTEAVGTVQRVTRESVVVQFENARQTATVDRSEITRLDVSVAQQRKVLKSSGVGMLIGAASGVVIGLASGDDERTFLALSGGDEGVWLGDSAGEKAKTAGIALGLLGGAVGVIVGAIRTHDVWSPTLPANLDLAVLPLMREGGAAVHVSFALRVR